MGEIAVMGKAGDTKVIWSADNEDEVANAKKTFADLLKKGFTAFAVKKDGDTIPSVTAMTAARTTEGDSNPLREVFDLRLAGVDPRTV